MDKPKLHESWRTASLSTIATGVRDAARAIRAHESEILQVVQCIAQQKRRDDTSGHSGTPISLGPLIGKHDAWIEAQEHYDALVEFERQRRAELYCPECDNQLADAPAVVYRPQDGTYLCMACAAKGPTGEPGLCVQRPCGCYSQEQCNDD